MKYVSRKRILIGDKSEVETPRTEGGILYLEATVKRNSPAGMKLQKEYDDLKAKIRKDK